MFVEYCVDILIPLLMIVCVAHSVVVVVVVEPRVGLRDGFRTLHGVMWRGSVPDVSFRG